MPSASRVMQTAANPTLNMGLYAFTNGIDVDRHLAPQEVKVQLAWADGLARTGYLKADDLVQIRSVLEEALGLIQSGSFEWRVEDEDIHMNLERFVTGKLGIVGKRMHYGRSRNDLVATTLRLYVRDSLDSLTAAAMRLLHAYLHQAEATLDVLVPAKTHLQNAQPMRLGQLFLTYAQETRRDLERLTQAQARAMESMPMGAAACTGTPLDIDLGTIAKELGFRSGPLNSYDAVADRDFMLEGLQAKAILATHMSRFAEDMLYECSSTVGLLRIPKAWSTGSSMMPNKRNPDVPELTRAKMARVIGCANEGLNLVRTVVHSYGSDLHELKRTYLTAEAEFTAALAVLPPFVESLEVDTARAAELLGSGHILATEIADALTMSGMAFREMGIQLTPVATTHSVRCRGRGLSPQSDGVRAAVCQR